MIDRRKLLLGGLLSLLSAPAVASSANTMIWRTFTGHPKYDCLMFGCSHTSGFPYPDIDLPCGRLSVLECGLEGNEINGIVSNIQNLFVNGGRFAEIKPRLVIIEGGGVNGSLWANQSSWLTPAQWIAKMASAVQSILDAGAACIVLTNFPIETSADNYASAANIAAYDAQIRTTLHDQFYYPNMGRFAICDVAVSMGDGLHARSGCTQDGIHPTPTIYYQFRNFWLANTVAQYGLQIS